MSENNKYVKTGINLYVYTQYWHDICKTKLSGYNKPYGRKSSTCYDVNNLIIYVLQYIINSWRIPKKKKKGQVFRLW